MSVYMQKKDLSVLLSKNMSEKKATRNDGLYVSIGLGKYATKYVWIYIMPKIGEMYVYYI